MRHSIKDLIRAAIRHPLLCLKYAIGQDPSEISLKSIERHLGRSPVSLLEAGAFDGKDTIRFLNFWPDLRVYAFEPIPKIADLLTARASGYSNIEVFRTALVGDQVNTIEIHTFADSEELHASSSILNPTEHLELAPSVRFGSSIVVPATTLDSWATEHQVSTLDVLWLDLQGAELSVLKRGTQLLSNTSVCHLEVSRRPLYQGAATVREIDGFMQAQGFVKVCERVPVVMGNALYVNKLI